MFWDQFEYSKHLNWNSLYPEDLDMLEYKYSSSVNKRSHSFLDYLNSFIFYDQN